MARLRTDSWVSFLFSEISTTYRDIFTPSQGYVKKAENLSGIYHKKGTTQC